MAAYFSWRGLIQSLFEADDEALGDVVSPVTSARSLRWSHNSNRSDDASPSPANTGTSDEPSVPYSPSRLDGEYDVWFLRKPLGLGLVPSTQLYGTWEISTVAPPASSSAPSSPTGSPARHQSVTPQSRSQAHQHYHDETEDRRKIRRGDIIIALNYNTQPAKLPRDEFISFLQKTACPIVITFRRPALYGSFDSRSMSTAMFPNSFEYRGKDKDLEKKTFYARAPSMQWKRSLQHELSKRSTSKKTMDSAVKKLKAKVKFVDESHGASDSSAPSSMSLPISPLQKNEASGSAQCPRRTSQADLTPMGEYSHIFHDAPLQLVLAPSTRLYGSVEVYDAKQYSPLIQLGDVVMAVNGDSSVAKSSTNDVISHIEQLTPPITITFRRPSAYRRYLEVYFKTTHSKISSVSTATAMFPDSAEYKHGYYRQTKPPKSEPKTKMRRDSMADTSIEYPRRNSVEGQGTMTKDEWEQVSKQLSASDQFKLWQSGSGRKKTKSSRQKKFGNSSKPFSPSSPSKLEISKSTSAFLTERHVHYLWAHLPEYLTCNDMELVYDTRRHGWNLLSFYSLVEDKGPTILVIKDTRDRIFGAFSSCSWKRSADVYGNGRCFVFTLRPQMRVYAWSGLDDTFMHGRRDSIFMGGGKRGTALCIQLDELRGFTHACDTFDSPPLTAHANDGDNGDFEIENMEVWCFSGLRV